jgi:hypothetical protein
MKTIRDETCRSELIARIEKLTGDEKAAWGKMSLEQMLSHLVQTGALPFETIMDDHSNVVSRTLLKPLVLYVLPIPKDVKVGPELDQQQNGRKPLGISVDKANLVESINKLAALPENHDCLGHPFFGKMSAKEWAVMAHKHIDHHLRQFGV